MPCRRAEFVVVWITLIFGGSLLRVTVDRHSRGFLSERPMTARNTVRTKVEIRRLLGMEFHELHVIDFFSNPLPSFPISGRPSDEFPRDCSLEGLEDHRQIGRHNVCQLFSE